MCKQHKTRTVVPVPPLVHAKVRTLNLSNLRPNLGRKEGYPTEPEAHSPDLDSRYTEAKLQLKEYLQSQESMTLGTKFSRHPFNQFLFSTVPKPFHIVNPKQVVRQSLEPVDTRERQLPHHGIYEHAEQVTFQIVIDKKKHKLKLQRNE
ncbi:hypothetical protein DPMN_048544 [Dreissena polymorpha]|uniref:Uncharacterized protein n=1 Tax=Dreissena polymorpha TaxID=45954 RepID=A0A9D4DCL2_DREPO|nr:hypothetical protein DPMN_048544 [Dreissena polymorpha]